MAHFTIGKIITRSLLSKYSTRLYPFAKREPYEATRGHIENAIQVCILCSICQKKCPTGAITVKKAEKTWEIDRMLCIQCGACVDACPKKCLSMAHDYAPAATVKEIVRLRQETSSAPSKPAPAKE